MLQKKPTPEEQFWSWFADHETELFEFDPTDEDEREKLFDLLAAELQKVDRDLTFEFGPRQARREFVISAGGIRRAFSSVVMLAKAAPRALDRWKIIAFRPRRAPVGTIEFRDQVINPADVQFTLLDDGKLAGIYLFLPGYQEGDVAFQQIGYLMLDATLGEYDVETRLGLIKVLSPDNHADGRRYPLAALAEMFDKLVSRLEGSSGKSS